MVRSVKKSIEIRWWGHACVEVVYAGKRLMIDPHDGGGLGVGWNPPPSGPDYVLVTHEHYDHNAVEKVATSSTKVYREHVGKISLPPFQVEGVKVPHDEWGGKLRGEVVAYIVQAGDLRLAHLGDIGGRPSEQVLEKLYGVHIAFAPAGGVYTLHPKQVLELAREIDAKVLIPIHYWLPGIQLPLEPLDTILRYAKKWRVVHHESNTITLSADELPTQPTILVLKPPTSNR